MSCNSNSTNAKALLCLTACLAVVGCGYGEVSPAAYQYAQSLYGLANRKASDRIELVSQKIDEALQSEAISAREAQWLEDIVDLARQGDWERAQKSSRRMMQDQVTRGRSDRPSHSHKETAAAGATPGKLGPNS